MLALSTLLLSTAVAAIWGSTDAWMKYVADKHKSPAEGGGGVWEQRYVLLPWAANQCGTVIKIFFLGDAAFSLTEPVCNSLKLLFTAATGAALGERVDTGPRFLAGAALVICGIAICVSEQP